MNDPLHNRLDQLGERFRATAARTPMPEAFQRAAETKRRRRVAAERWMMVGGLLAAAACVAIVAWLPNHAPSLPGETPRWQANATSRPDSIAELTRRFPHGEESAPSGASASAASEPRWYAASFASSPQVQALLDGR